MGFFLLLCCKNEEEETATTIAAAATAKRWAYGVCTAAWVQSTTHTTATNTHRETNTRSHIQPIYSGIKLLLSQADIKLYTVFIALIFYFHYYYTQSQYVAELLLPRLYSISIRLFDLTRLLYTFSLALILIRLLLLHCGKKLFSDFNSIGLDTILVKVKFATRIPFKHNMDKEEWYTQWMNEWMNG